MHCFAHVGTLVDIGPAVAVPEGSPCTVSLSEQLLASLSPSCTFACQSQQVRSAALPAAPDQHTPESDSAALQLGNEALLPSCVQLLGCQSLCRSDSAPGGACCWKQRRTSCIGKCFAAVQGLPAYCQRGSWSCTRSAKGLRHMYSIYSYAFV